LVTFSWPEFDVVCYRFRGYRESSKVNVHIDRRKVRAF